MMRTEICWTTDNKLPEKATPLFARFRMVQRVANSGIRAVALPKIKSTVPAPNLDNTER